MKKATLPKKRAAKKAETGASRSQRGEPVDWRAGMLDRVRSLIREADPDAVETKKWRGVPVWEHDGIICTGETYRDKIKLTFARGAALKDHSGLFNSSLEGNVRRAIDIPESARINEKALKALFRAAVELNISTRAASKKKPKGD
jgi:hypothetical protein